MNMQEIVASIKTWWNGLNFEQWFGESSGTIVQVAVIFVAFFLVAFFFKKYLKYLFVSLVVAIILIKGLENYQILTINWAELNTALGFEPTATMSDIFNVWGEWVKNHAVICLASTIGLLIGCKLG